MDNYHDTTTSKDGTFDNENSNPTTVLEEQYQIIMEFISNNYEMKKTTKQSLKQGMYAGTGAIVGGLLLGPVGGLLGGIGGTLIGYNQSTSYNGFIQQLVVLERTRQNKLVDAVKAILINTASNQNPDSIRQTFTSSSGFKTTLFELATQKKVQEQIWNVCMEAIHE